MVFRKLFKEPGPPRPRPSSDDLRYAQYSSWSEPPPGVVMSPYPAHLSPQVVIGMQQSAFQSAPFYPDPQTYALNQHGSAQYRQTLPHKALHSDQVYPGINYKPPSHQDRAKEMFTDALVSSEPVIHKQKKGHWRHKLFSRDFSSKMKKINNHTLPSNQDHLPNRGDITTSSMYPLPGTSQRNKLQRALDALKIKSFAASRRCSMDDLPITSSRQSILPPRNGIEQSTRKSLDSAYDTLRGRNAIHAFADGQDIHERHGVGKAGEGDVYLSVSRHPQQSKSETMQASHKALGAAGKGSEHRHWRDDLLPKQDTPASLPQDHSGALAGYPEAYKPTLEDCLAPTAHQDQAQGGALVDQSEWQRVHRQAVQKYEDWINDITSSQQMHLVSSPDRGASPAVPPLSSDKQAVYKMKGDNRQTTHVAQLFDPPVERQSHSRNASGTLGVSLTKRGFAEKMFAEEVPLGILESAKGKDKETGRVAKTKPLPDPPRQKIKIQGAIEKGKGQKSSSNGQHANIRQFDWGSLGPPSHLALPATTSIATDNGRIAIQDRQNMVKTPIPEQRANEKSFLDSTTTPYGKGQVHLVIDPLDVSPKDVISRIQEWRVKTSVTPVKNLYAASASPSAPQSDEQRRSEDRASVASDLTSVSRRATVDNNVMKQSATPLITTSQVTVKEQRASPRADLPSVQHEPLSNSSISSRRTARKMTPDQMQSGDPATPKDPISTLSKQHSALQADLSAANDTDAKRARDWASIIKKLALCLESDADNAVETLLSQHGKDLKQLYKESPEFLLMLSVKLGQVSRREDASHVNRNKPAHPGSRQVVEAADFTRQAECIGERGEISQLQTSLLDLHRRILDWRGDTESLTKRLSMLEQAVYTTN